MPDRIVVDKYPITGGMTGGTGCCCPGSSSSSSGANCGTCDQCEPCYAITPTDVMLMGDDGPQDAGDTINGEPLAADQAECSWGDTYYVSVPWVSETHLLPVSVAGVCVDTSDPIYFVFDLSIDQTPDLLPPAGIYMKWSATVPATPEGCPQPGSYPGVLVPSASSVTVPDCTLTIGSCPESIVAQVYMPLIFNTQTLFGMI